MLNYTDKYIAVLSARCSGGKEVLTGNILGCYDDEKTALEGFLSLGAKAVEMVRRQSENISDDFIFSHFYLYGASGKGLYSPSAQTEIIKIDFVFKNGKLV